MVSISASEDEEWGGGGKSRLPRFHTYTEFFEHICPFYMAFGMAYSEFWDGDVWMAKAYREAFDIRKERDNFNAWLQGLYIYEAICDASPILRAFSKARKPAPYPKEPYPINTALSKQRKEDAEDRKRKQEDEMFIANMNAWAEAFNKQFEEKPPETETGRGDPPEDHAKVVKEEDAG